jgi:hypothetical protein
MTHIESRVREVWGYIFSAETGLEWRPLETSRFPHFLDNQLRDVAEVVRLTRQSGALYPPGRFLVISVRR